jgi:ribonuclease E
MTFYEAAVRVLEREGKPLHVNAITEIALKENFLSHVGKSPEEVMQSRLLAMARRRTERRIVATAKLTYGLVDWGLPEDLAALEPAVEKSEVAEEPPLRPRERHPVPSPDKVRIAGRGERPRKGRKEGWEERRKQRRRLPPLAEVAFEILAANGSGPMAALDIAAAARDKELVSEDLGAEALLNALREDNRRRAEAGRRPAFLLAPGGEVELDRGAQPPEPIAEQESGAALSSGAGLAGLIEAPRREELRGSGAVRLLAQLNEQRRNIQRLLRRRLADLDAGAFEKAGLLLLEVTGYRDLRLVRRTRDGAVLTARKREGLLDLRTAIQLRRGGGEVTREEVESLRRDAAQAGAQLAILATPAEPRGDARQEAQAAEKLVVILLCGESLAERFLERRIGAASAAVEVFDLDEDFFRRCREVGKDVAREGRAREGGREEERDRRARGDRLQPMLPREARGPEEARRAPEAAAPPDAEAAAPKPDVGLASARQPEGPPEAREAPVFEAAAPAGPPQGEEANAARRREEAEARAAAHERIERAELQTRQRTSDQAL